MTEPDAGLSALADHWFLRSNEFSDALALAMAERGFANPASDPPFEDAVAISTLLAETFAAVLPSGTDAVNDYDRLRAIEAAARTFFEDEHECLHDDDPPCGLADLRAALEVAL